MSSSPGNNTLKLGLVAGVCVAVGSLLWYLFADDKESGTTPSTSSDGAATETKKSDSLVSRGAVGAKSKLVANTATKEEVLALLQSVIDSQKTMKNMMKELTQKLCDLPESEMTFETVYDLVKSQQPSDPLEAAGVDMSEFDKLVEKYQGDSAIGEAISQIMGAPGAMMSSMPLNAVRIRPQEIVAVHRFMLTELSNFVASFKERSDTNKYDMKAVTISEIKIVFRDHQPTVTMLYNENSPIYFYAAAQAIVGANTQRRYGYTADDIEASVYLHHQVLATDPDFTHINMEMQYVMSELLGAQLFESGFF